MFLDVGAGQHQSQNLAISTQAIQSINILQFGVQELQEFLLDQAEANPLLEIVPPASDLSRARIDSFGPRGPVASRTLSDDDWKFVAEPVSLREKLLQQVSQAIAHPNDRQIAEEIVEAIDDDGYFRNNVEDFARFLNVSKSDVMRILSTVQTFEPTGIGARDLAECLSLQLEERGELTPAMQRLLENLPLLANFDMVKLAQRCRVTPAAVKKMSARIRQLCPAPGRLFDNDQALPAMPDVLVRRSDDGAGVVVELNPALMPKVLVDRSYLAEIRHGAANKVERRYIADCYKSAIWLTRSLGQRAYTMLKVATELVARQKAFFEGKSGNLNPLDLKTLAGAVGLHESTISRAVANKFIMSDRGLFEMKHFFSTALQTTTGDGDVSADAVQRRIKDLVAAEHIPLTDDDIAHVLESEGIHIARRTVAKYRMILNIQPSIIRKRQREMA
jgi:RNA polymerase sigma-54 factor